MKVAIEVLSGIPGKCGTVGNLWRNNLKYPPPVDPGIEYFVFVTPALADHYFQYRDYYLKRCFRSAVFKHKKKSNF